MKISSDNKGMDPRRNKIFTGSSNPEFAKKVSDFLSIPLGKCELSRFSDGEIQVSIGENIRGSHVFLIQSTCPPGK